MIQDLLFAPFDLGFMRRALAGCVALSLAGPPLGRAMISVPGEANACSFS